MIEHVTVTYETFDGKIFTDELEAYAYENQTIYKQSGFRFYDKEKRMIKNVDWCYDYADYFTIDHSKERANQLFIEMANNFYGWSFPHDILVNKDAKRYRYDSDSECWRKSVSRKKVSKIK